MCGLCLTDVGDHPMKDPTYGFAKRAWDVRSGGFPGADMRLDLIGGGDGLTLVDQIDGSPQPGASEGAASEKALLGRAPGLDKEIEPLVEAAPGVLIEIGRAASGFVTNATSIAGRATPPPLGGAPLVAAFMRVTDDGGEVAVADARAAATRVRPEAALGIAEIVERIAAEDSHEGLARARHRVLVVDCFEEEPRGAIFGTRIVPLPSTIARSTSGSLPSSGWPRCRRPAT